MKVRLFSILVFSGLTFAVSQGTLNTNSTICWDTSFSMLDRDLNKEFDLLDKVFQKNPNQTVQLILFNLVPEEKEFNIVNGDWSDLKSLLIQTKADGATVYNGLAKLIKNDQVYFFTDGNTLNADDMLPVKKGDFIINSLINRNENFLKRAALIGRGRLMDFAAVLPEHIQATVNPIVTPGLEVVSGTVYIDNVPTNNIEVRLKGSGTVYTTDSNGKFSVPAVPGDSILFSSRLNRTMKTVPIGYFNKNIDVFLEANVTTLDEVVVTEKRVETVSNELVNTGTGLKNKESVGYAVQSIGEEKITQIQTDLSQTVQGKFSNVTLGNDQDLTQFEGRSNNTLLGNNYGLVVVDGVPIEQSNSGDGRTKPSDSKYRGYRANASFIDPSNVASITVLKGFAATNRYGTLGNGGVLLITTKTAKTGRAGKATAPTENNALVQDNIYDSEMEISTLQSPVTKALESMGTLMDAYDKYLMLRNFNQESDSFYLDAFSYFKDKDKKIALRIISNLWENKPKSESYLRTVQLSAKYLGDYAVAEIINGELNTKSPTAIQPFFTEARLQLANGNYQEALSLFSELEKGGSYNSINVAPIRKSLERELKNLIFLKRSSLDVANIKEAFFKNTQMNQRLLVEWNNPKAEFQIQFVNPQDRFFNWEHTNVANPSRIQEEIEFGYAMEEFELYDDMKGEWTINANFIGNLDPANQEPLVLLCTTYSNFGYPSQTEDKFLIYLDYQYPIKKLVSFTIK